MRTVVKVQVPLMSTETNAPALVYDKPRRNQGFLQIDDDLKAAMKGAPKRFFEAEITKGEVKVIYNREVPDPGW